MSGPITALVAASPRRKVTIFWRRTSGRCDGRKEGLQERQGYLAPFALHERGTMISPVLAHLALTKDKHLGDRGA